jgi:hypothetical protein
MIEKGSIPEDELLRKQVQQREFIEDTSMRVLFGNDTIKIIAVLDLFK